MRASYTADAGKGLRLSEICIWDICIFNYHIGNTDNHIKNVSLLYDPNMTSVRLAPAYNIVSTLIYPGSTIDMAFAIGNKYDIHRISREDFRSEAENVGMGDKVAMKHYDYFADKLEGALKKSCEKLMEQGFVQAEDIRNRILDKRKDPLA